MPDNVVTTRVVSAHHTSQVWATINTVPKAGEICLETDTLKFKVGDGTHTYAELSYFNAGFNTITDGTSSVVVDGTLTLTGSGGTTITFDNTNKAININSSSIGPSSETTVESGNSTGGLGSLKVTKDGVTTYPIAYGLGTMAGESKTDYLPLSGGTLTGALTLSGAPSSNLQAATKKYVDDAISGLPTPMQFKGTVGTSGTVEWANLPSASSSNVGYTYKVITDHDSTPVCKAGDTIVSDGSSWVVIPSGDEPSGTVTNVATGSGLTGGPITSSGTISHADTSSQASISATTLKYVDSLTLDDFGHVTGATVSTMPDSSASAKGVIQLANTTASGGISASLSSGVATLSHTNSVTAVTTEAFSTIAYDGNGHITSSTPVTIIDGNFS